MAATRMARAMRASMGRCRDAKLGRYQERRTGQNQGGAEPTDGRPHDTPPFPPIGHTGSRFGWPDFPTWPKA
jgi:hypothetical protein